MNEAVVEPTCSDNGWTVVLPCAAPSKEPSMRPKWLYTTPEGDLVVCRAAASMPGDIVTRLIVTFLRDCDERWGVTRALQRAFGDKVECIVLDEPTAGPAATVRKTVEQAGITGPLSVKDGDSFFSLCDRPTGAFVAVADLRQMPCVSEPGRKSYVRLNEQHLITDIVEKNVVSNYISVGLYGFSDARIFVEEYDRLSAATPGAHLFVSHVVASGLSHGRIFAPCNVCKLVDIETQADWNTYRAAYSTLALDIDGVIFRNQSLFFAPYWGDVVEPIDANIRHLRSIQAQGAQLVFMTARPETFREVTLAALEAVGLRVHALIMGCNHAARYIVNDYAPTNPFPSAIAVNLRRNTGELQHLLEDRRSLNREL